MIKNGYIKPHKFTNWRIGDIITEEYLNKHHVGYYAYNAENILKMGEGEYCNWIGNRVIEDIHHSSDINEIVMKLSNTASHVRILQHNITYDKE